MKGMSARWSLWSLGLLLPTSWATNAPTTYADLTTNTALDYVDGVPFPEYTLVGFAVGSTAVSFGSTSLEGFLTGQSLRMAIDITVTTPTNGGTLIFDFGMSSNEGGQICTVKCCAGTGYVTTLGSLTSSTLSWDTITHALVGTGSHIIQFECLTAASGAPDMAGYIDYLAWQIDPSSSPTTSVPTTSLSPTLSPSESPTTSPSVSPSTSPSTSPSVSPSTFPSASPSVSPSASPSTSPSESPTTSPSVSPSTSPSVSPSTFPSASPSASPSVSPSASPSKSPSESTTTSPSVSPSTSPSVSPSTSPSVSPSTFPSASPSVSPSASPSTSPSTSPSVFPSSSPSASTSAPPSAAPSTSPSVSPSMFPSASHSGSPSASPRGSPSESSSTSPSGSPSESSSTSSSMFPSSLISESPSGQPSRSPSASPSLSSAGGGGGEVIITNPPSTQHLTSQPTLITLSTTPPAVAGDGVFRMLQPPPLVPKLSPGQQEVLERSVQLADPAVLKVQGGERVTIAGARLLEVAWVAMLDPGGNVSSFWNLSFALHLPEGDDPATAMTTTTMSFLSPPIWDLTDSFDPNSTDTSLRGRPFAHYTHARLHFHPPNQQPLTTNIYEEPLLATNFLYYSMSSCRDPGQWSRSLTECVSCPQGGFCPGGGRVWSEAGFWNRDEWTAPNACRFVSACLGSADLERRNPATAAAEARKPGRTCATGFTGDFCAQCEPNYYSDRAHCRACSGADAEDVRLSLVATTAAILLACLWMLLALAHVAWFPQLLSLVRALQGVVVVGQMASPALPDSLLWLVEVITFLSVFNFDLGVTKPGCVVPLLPYSDSLWIMLAVFAVALFLLAPSAALTFAAFQRLETDHQQLAYCLDRWQLVDARARSFRVNFSRRLQAAMLFVLLLFYLQMSIVLFNGVNCQTTTEETAFGSTVTTETLTVDPRAVCYGAGHSHVAPVVWVLLALFTCGFPISLAASLYKKFGHESHQATSSSASSPPPLYTKEPSAVSNPHPPSDVLGGGVLGTRALVNDEAEQEKAKEMCNSHAGYAPRERKRARRWTSRSRSVSRLSGISLSGHLPSGAKLSRLGTFVKGIILSPALPSPKSELERAIVQEEDRWGPFLVAFVAPAYWYGALEIIFVAALAASTFTEGAGLSMLLPCGVVFVEGLVVHSLRPYRSPFRNVLKMFTSSLVIGQAGVLFGLSDVDEQERMWGLDYRVWLITLIVVAALAFAGLLKWHSITQQVEQPKRQHTMEVLQQTRLQKGKAKAASSRQKAPNLLVESPSNSLGGSVSGLTREVSATDTENVTDGTGGVPMHRLLASPVSRSQGNSRHNYHPAFRNHSPGDIEEVTEHTEHTEHTETQLEKEDEKEKEESVDSDSIISADAHTAESKVLPNRVPSVSY